MRYPIDHYLTVPRGYTFGVPTFYSDFHLGLDLIIPTGTPIYAPTNGKVLDHQNGKQGGLTVHFLDSFGQYWRFMHNESFETPLGPVTEGTVLAISDNTGLSGMPHTHIDISLNGQLQINNRDNFIDPEKYIKEHVMNEFDNHVIRNRATGSFAYVARGKKQQYDNSNGSIALSTFFDRLPSGRFPQDFFVNVEPHQWDAIPTTTENFFPPMK